MSCLKCYNYECKYRGLPYSLGAMKEDRCLLKSNNPIIIVKKNKKKVVNK